MNFFIRLNMSSILYALFPAACIELMVNGYRISRLTGWDLELVNALTLGFCICGTLFSSFGFPKLIRYWLGGRKASFFSLVLWIPYFLILIRLLASWFPMMNPVDKPNPVTGLIALAALGLYPFYLAVLHGFGTVNFDTNRR